MKAIALTNEGIEDISVKEIKEITGVSAEQKKEILIFDAKLEDIFKVIYKAQSLKKVLLILYASQLNSLNLEQTDLKLIKSKSFVIDGYGKDKEKTEQEIIKFLKEKGFKINYNHPELRFFYLIDGNNFYLCLDVSQEDLSRRNYRIFLKPESYKGNIAYAMVRLAEYNSKEMLLDPFCRDGIIGIESAIFASGKSPNHYNKEKLYFTKIKEFEKIDFSKLFENFDKQISQKETKIMLIDQNFANVQAAKKNAKIAGVIENIQFSRESIEWLDAKFEKQSIDKIITFPIQISASLPENKIEKIYNLFFERAGFILKKKGKIVCGVKRGAEFLKKKAEENKFKIMHERIVKQGKENVVIVVFEKF